MNDFVSFLRNLQGHQCDSNADVDALFAEITRRAEGAREAEAPRPVMTRRTYPSLDGLIQVDFPDWPQGGRSGASRTLILELLAGRVQLIVD